MTTWAGRCLSCGMNIARTGCQCDGMTLCDCGALTWPGGALAIWADGRLHRPDEPCIEVDDLAAVTL